MRTAGEASPNRLRVSNTRCVRVSVLAHTGLETTNACVVFKPDPTLADSSSLPHYLFISTPLRCPPTLSFPSSQCLLTLHLQQLVPSNTLPARQLVFISVGVARPQRHLSGPAGDGVPQRDSSPMMLLLEEKHFTQLLQLMHKLSALRAQVGGCVLAVSPSRAGNILILSHRVLSSEICKFWICQLVMAIIASGLPAILPFLDIFENVYHE